MAGRSDSDVAAVDAPSSRGSVSNVRRMRQPPDPLAPKIYSDRVEVKFGYAIDESRRQTRYRSESYFFVPRSIGLDQYTYSRDEFFSDMNVFVRFAEPSIPSSVLADADDRQSPLCRAVAAVESAERGRESAQSVVSHEMRMFACIVRTNLRRVASEVHTKMQRIDAERVESVLSSGVQAAVVQLLGDLDGQLGALRQTRDTFFQPGRAGWLTNLFEYVDEYVSIAAEECVTSMLIKIDSAPPAVRSALADVRARAAGVAVAEQEYRRNVGYQVGDASRGGHREYVHHLGELSRFVRSVLFLEISKEEEGRRLKYMITGIAAAVATAFSTAVAIWARVAYGIDSLPFLMAVMVGYIFKDRIRQWLRTYFRRLAANRMFDYSVRIREPNTKTVLGICRESFEFVPLSDVPPTVLQSRYRNASPLEPQIKSEVVIRYIRDVRLRGRRIAKFGRRVRHLTEIHRINLARFLARMSEPEEEVASYAASVDQVVSVRYPKTYHINMVVTRWDDLQPATTGRYRLILDKSGVKTIQLVHGSRYDADDRTPSLADADKT